MAALTVLMRAVLQCWPLGLAGVFARVVALAVLAPWALTTGRGWRRFKPWGIGQWLALMCVLSLLVNFAVFKALEWTTATNHAILYRLDTVFVVLIGSLLGLERMGRKELLLLLVMLVGMALVAEIGQSGFEVHWAGDLLIIAAAAGFAINAFVCRKIVRTIEPETLAIYNIVFGSLGFVGLSFTRREWEWLAHTPPDSRAWLMLVLLGIMIAVFLAGYYAILRRMPIWKLRTWMLIVPMLVALADWLLWSTRLTGLQWLGTGLLIGGLAVLIQLERVTSETCPAEDRVVREQTNQRFG